MDGGSGHEPGKNFARRGCSGLVWPALFLHGPQFVGKFVRIDEPDAWDALARCLEALVDCAVLDECADVKTSNKNVGGSKLLLEGLQIVSLRRHGRAGAAHARGAL
ncbi:hypothetical protein DD236_02260 [Ancrocorticia populi]|uniref:Uncharacterized protein n=1 Tax=Ancrocorticia populi TaxID=2175228 RepID=A0A2V1K803_9ACTO|nr:hypothetical protein DD236_02260 [Ancrocorticia populi]